MGVVLSNWDSKLFATDVLKAFVEAGRIPDDSFMRSNTNESQIVYGNMASITVKNTADNVDLADAGATETSTIISADLPLKGWVYIPKSAITTHGSASVVSNYAMMLGQNLREQFEKRISNLVATSSPTSVAFDDELTTATGLGAAVAEALVTVVKNFDAGNVPNDGRICLLHPTYFTTLWNQAGMRSSDYIQGVDNAKPFSEINFLGMRVRSFNGNFGTDTSADTNYDSKYRINMSNATGNKCWGVAWQRSALAVNYYEMPTVEDGEVFHKDSILVKGRVLIGTGLTRSAPARQIIVGD